MGTKVNTSASNQRNEALQAVEPDTANAEKLAVSTSNAETTASFQGVVRLCSDVDVYYNLGADDATTSDAYLPAGVIEYIAVGITEGAALKLNFICASGSGNVSIVASL